MMSVFAIFPLNFLVELLGFFFLPSFPFLISQTISNSWHRLRLFFSTIYFY